MLTTERQIAQFAEDRIDTELNVKLTWGQCNLIGRMIDLARGLGDLAEYDSDLSKITSAITDAMVSDIEAGLDDTPPSGTF